jgi:hypothetical protein
MQMLSGARAREERLAFSSAAGQKVTAENAARAADQSVIPRGQGVAFVLSTPAGVLAPYGVTPLQVTVLTDGVGQFEDQLVVAVRNLGVVRIIVRVGVSGLPLAIAKRTPGVLFPDSACAAPNRIENVQTRLLAPVHAPVEVDSDELASSSPATLQSENALVRSAAAASGLVQVGFDAYPKLFFRPLLVHVGEALRSAHIRQASGIPDNTPPSSFERRLTYDTSALGAHVASGRALVPEQVRVLHLENSGPTDLQVRFKQYDLRRIDHARVVDVRIRPTPATAASGDASLVQVDIERYVYPFNKSEGHDDEDDTPADDDDANSFDSGSGFPFVLDPPVLVVPARSSASLRVIYDPASLVSGGGFDTAAPTHDLSFLEGLIYVPDEQQQHSSSTSVVEQLQLASSVTSPTNASGAGVGALSARAKKTGKVLSDIEAFEGRTGAALYDGADSSDDEDPTIDLAATQKRSVALATTTSATSSAVAAYFKPKAAVRWVRAPEHLSRHLFRLVLSGRTIAPNLHVDKAKGRLKFVLQAPRPDPADAEAAALQSAPHKTGMKDLASPKNAKSIAASVTDRLTKTLPRGSTGSGADAAPLGKTLPTKDPLASTTTVIHAHVPSVSSSSARAQLTAVKMLPLENRSGVALTFTVSLSPASRFALQVPQQQQQRVDSKRKATAVPASPATTSRNNLLASLSAALPPPSHLGWTAAQPLTSAVGVAGAATPTTFTLQPGESLVLPVRFMAPPPDVVSASEECDAWPLQPRTVVEGALTATFANGSVQRIPLVGELLRPVLSVQPRAHQFGSVHVRDVLSQFGPESDESGSFGLGGSNNDLGDELSSLSLAGSAAAGIARSRAHQARLAAQRLVLSLSNPSFVDAHWSLAHVPRPSRPAADAQLRGGAKESMHAPTLKALASREFDEDADVLDDPAVFVFASRGGVVPAGTGALADAAHALPSGPASAVSLTAIVEPAMDGRNLSGSTALLGSTRPAVALRVPVRVGVSFRPALQRRYRSVFRFACLHGADSGRSIDVELRGEGVFHENVPVIA